VWGGLAGREQVGVISGLRSAAPATHESFGSLQHLETILQHLHHTISTRDDATLQKLPARKTQ
jgi:hypothetical protein